MHKDKIRQGIKSREEFERIYFPEKKEREVIKVRAPYEYGASLASQAIEKFGFSSHK